MKIDAFTQRAIVEAFARSQIYQLLSNAFSYPQAEFFEIFRPDFVESLKDCINRVSEGGDNRRARGFDELISAFPADSLTALEEEYHRAFAHTTTELAPPYETQYGTAHIFQQMQTMGDIGGFYRAFGLERSNDAKERIDHIAVELEFMYFLTYKEAYALLHHGGEKTEICRDAQRRFLGEHLGRWAPVFARRLREKIGGGFYVALAAFTDEFLQSEAARLGVQPNAASAPIEMGLDENCMTCGLNELVLQD
jgi:DMSO reductase family type II enzyme chaperone